VTGPAGNGPSGDGQAGNGGTGRRRGRPRKWTNDAERQAAYRARRASEQSDVDVLRRELREARAALAAVTRERGRLLRQLGKQEHETSPDWEIAYVRDELRALQDKFRSLNADYLRLLSEPPRLVPLTLPRSTSRQPWPPPRPAGRA
jgi:hypothetical protein